MSGVDGKILNTFIPKLVPWLFKYLRARQERVIVPVAKFSSPDGLKKQINFDLNHLIADFPELNDVCQKILDHSVNTSHPYFFNQLFVGGDPYAILAQIIVALLNTSMYTYEMAPVFNLMEEAVFVKVRRLFNWPESTQMVFCPGGSMSNFQAIYLACFSMAPEIKKIGLMRAQRPVYLFISEHAHYSFRKAAFALGIGLEQVIKIPADDYGKIQLDILEDQLERIDNNSSNNSTTYNSSPIKILVATAGTTVLGAFDPILQMAQLAKKYGAWLHVDGAWGGSAIWSPRLRHQLKGLNQADSMTWNPHKMMRIPLPCSLLIVKEGHLLATANGLAGDNNDYLFQPDKCYDPSLDKGDRHWQCGRQVDVFKLWLPWKIYGDLQWSGHVALNYQHTKYLADQIRGRQRWSQAFKLVTDLAVQSQPPPSYCQLCFWYIPPQLRDRIILTTLNDTVEHFDQLHPIAPAIKAKMLQTGSLMVGYQPLIWQGQQLPNFFRLVLINSSLTQIQLDQILARIDYLGSKI